ncbi:MAG: lysophospholipid acyltransferase family protein, partial [Planctomycetota bacterium]
RDLLAYLCIRALSCLCRVLGVRGSAALGCLFGMGISVLDDRRGRARVLRHMARAVGARRAGDLLPRYYEHLGLLIVEFARMWSPRRSDFADWIAPDGAERVRAILASGRGMIGITGHLGCWELAGHCVAVHGGPTHALYRPLKNPYIDRHLRSLREQSGMFVYEKRDALRTTIRVLRASEAVGILVDQDGSGMGVFVPFFGELASTLPTAARIARRTGSAIVPVTCYRDRSRAFHRLRIGPEVEQADTGDAELDVLITTRNCNRALEDAILEHPAQWLWRHRRWNTRPTPEAVDRWRAAETAIDAGEKP